MRIGSHYVVIFDTHEFAFDFAGWTFSGVHFTVLIYCLHAFSSIVEL